jgi:hypothetical protein
MDESFIYTDAVWRREIKKKKFKNKLEQSPIKISDKQYFVKNIN